MSGRTIAIDLETISNPRMIDNLPEIKSDPRLKDPEKIKADIEKKKKDAVSKMGLSPITGLICCISATDTSTMESKSFFIDTKTLSETKMLNDFWQFAHSCFRFVTFNGIQFDVPFLNFRSMIANIQPSVRISTKMYQVRNHVDLRMILGNWDRQASGKLETYCKAILGPDAGKSDGIDGSMVQDMMDVGAYDVIMEYCEKDTELTAQLFNRVKAFYL